MQRLTRCGLFCGYRFVLHNNRLVGRRTDVVPEIKHGAGQDTSQDDDNEKSFVGILHCDLPA